MNIKNLVLILGIMVIVSVFFIYFAFFGSDAEKFQDDQDGEGRIANSRNLNEGMVDDGNTFDKDFIIENEETNAAGGGGGGGGDSAGIAGVPSETEGSEAEQQSERLCLVARPGNIEGIECSVNFIQSGSISLKITNNAEEDILVNMVLEGCSNETNGTVLSGRQDNFVFSCDAEDYFEKSLHVTYTISGNVIKLNGIVSGTVS